jgi:hypothetical protein
MRCFSIGLSLCIALPFAFPGPTERRVESEVLLNNVADSMLTDEEVTWWGLGMDPTTDCPEHAKSRKDIHTPPNAQPRFRCAKRRQNAPILTSTRGAPEPSPE